MARQDPRTGSGRLAAVLDPRPVDPVDGLREPPPVVAARGGPESPRLAALAGRWLPAAWRGARLDPGWPGAVALLLVAAVAAVLAAVGVWRAAPRPEPVADLPPLVSTTGPTPGPVSTGPSVSPGPPEQLVVAVAGRVARPGLVHVPAGARVADVLDAAGGALPGTDLSGVNLARRVSDGEQVAVGVPAAPDAVPEGAASAAAPGGTAAGGQPGGLLDLNTATVEQLDGLPGVGPVTAQRIVEWRMRNGRFAAVDQLREVDGIGERRFAQLRGLVRV